MAMSANGLDPQAKVDRWQICRFTPPSHIMIDVGVALAGQAYRVQLVPLFLIMRIQIIPVVLRK
jgi:hypothetical protein